MEKERREKEEREIQYRKTHPSYKTGRPQRHVNSGSLSLHQWQAEALLSPASVSFVKQTHTQPHTREDLTDQFSLPQEA